MGRKFDQKVWKSWKTEIRWVSSREEFLSTWQWSLWKLQFPITQSLFGRPKSKPHTFLCQLNLCQLIHQDLQQKQLPLRKQSLRGFRLRVDDMYREEVCVCSALHGRRSIAAARSGRWPWSDASNIGIALPWKRRPYRSGFLPPFQWRAVRLHQPARERGVRQRWGIVGGRESAGVSRVVFVSILIAWRRTTPVQLSAGFSLFEKLKCNSGAMAMMGGIGS